MKLQNIAIFALVTLIVGVSSYYFGFQNGRRAEHLTSVKSEIAHHLYLFRVAEAGNMEKLQADLGMLILANSEVFSPSRAPVEDSQFQARLTEAIENAMRVKTNTIVMSR